jgi:transposase InsO family protein
MCQWLRVSRLSFCRYWAEKAPAEEESALRDQLLQSLSLQHPHYGSRRLAQLLKRAGKNVNRKRVQRIMREDNLLCLRRKKFVVTTDSNHVLGLLSKPGAGSQVNDNQPTLGGRHQLHSPARVM